MIDASFWHERWETNNIPFHESQPNPLLVENFSALFLNKGSRVFVPLCGKTLDLSWLLSKGCRVAGAELSQIAIEQLFAQLGLKPAISRIGALHRYSAQNIDIFVGDIFELSPEVMGPIDAIYDRAALVALPENMRGRYAAHLMKISNTAPQLLITFEYDQNLLQGPPFSVPNDEVQRHYGGAYNLTLLSSAPLPGGLKGKCPATENTWLLKRK
jgi:thiopurine S-methyltransferase